jgi:uncharacterized protein YndB with AHSA1/START domain
MASATIEQTIWISAPREQVWPAVSIPAELSAWLSPTTPEIVMDDGEDGKLTVFFHAIAVRENVDAPNQITLRNQPDGTTTVTFTLNEENGGTRVTLRMTMAGGDKDPEAVTSCGERWHMALENLKAHCEGTPLPQQDSFYSALFGYHIETKTRYAVERSIWIKASRERVWKAITDPAQIELWFSPGTSWRLSAAQVGGELSVYNPESDSYGYVQIIDTFEPPRKLVTREVPEPPAPPEAFHVTTYTLVEENGGTRLWLQHSGYEREAANVRRDNMNQNTFGFGMMLENLRAVAEDDKIPHEEGF